MPKETEKTTEIVKSTESIVEHVLGCSKCFQAIIKKAKETFKHECSNCGLPLPNDMIDLEYNENTSPCPNCGNTEARKIESEETIEEEES